MLLYCLYIHYNDSKYTHSPGNGNGNPQLPVIIRTQLISAFYPRICTTPTTHTQSGVVFICQSITREKNENVSRKTICIQYSTAPSVSPPPQRMLYPCILIISCTRKYKFNIYLMGYSNFFLSLGEIILFSSSSFARSRYIFLAVLIVVGSGVSGCGCFELLERKAKEKPEKEKLSERIAGNSTRNNVLWNFLCITMMGRGAGSCYEGGWVNPLMGLPDAWVGGESSNHLQHNISLYCRINIRWKGK